MNNFHHNFSGLGVALITPFKNVNNRSQVDESALTKLTRHCIEGGVDYLVCLGTTAETPTLTHDEKQQVLGIVKSANKEQIPIVVGIGGNNTNQLLESLSNQDFDGIAGVLSVTPYYNRPSQEGLFQHYKALSEHSPKPLILYNVPARTGANLLPETVVRIASECPNVVAIKEASGNFPQIMNLIHAKNESFSVISGDDSLAVPTIALGGNGLISVLANVFPRDCSKMIKAAISGDFHTARDIHYKLLTFCRLLFKDGNPAGVKAALNIIQIAENELRLPLSKVQTDTFDALKEFISSYLK